MFPWLVFLKRSGKRLSDIEYLAVQEFNGNVTTAEGTLSATGDLATITAGSGDMYLAKAKVSARMEIATAGAVTVIVELKVNAVIKATWSADLNATTLSSMGATSAIGYEFAVAGLKVTTGQVIKLEAVTVDASVEVNGELVCIEVATGASPAV